MCSPMTEISAGKADYNKDGLIHVGDLDLYVTDRFKDLSKGKQHPVVAKPASIRSFRLTKPRIVTVVRRGRGTSLLKSRNPAIHVAG